MELWKYARKNVKLVLRDSSIVLGFIQEYCSSDDNDEEVDSLALDVNGTLYEYFESEILSTEEV